MNTVNFQSLTPLLFLERSKNVFPNKVAIIDGEIQLTYLEFYEACISLAKAMKLIGIKDADKVAYICPNSYYMLIAHYAVSMLGAILVPINIRLNSDEINHILRHSETSLLLVINELFDNSYTATVPHIIVINDIGIDNSQTSQLISYESFIKSAKNFTIFSPKIIDDENSIISINYTSGTTGTPKGVMYSHRSTYLNALGECLQARLSSNSVYLWVLPMHHCNGWCFTWAVTAMSGTHVCMNKFDAVTTINSVIKYKITHMCAAPTILTLLTEAENFHLLKSTNHLTIITAGSSPSPKLFEIYEANNIRLLHVYGLTETHGPHVICEEQTEWESIPIEERALLKSKQGVSGIHSVFIKVVDKKNIDVTPDGKTIGEVIMRGNNIMLGYYRDSESTLEAFKNDWFHSGDLATIDKDGYIQIKDRSKDIIISGGENISSIDIENIISKLPEVRFVAVIPDQDKIWGNVPHAIIELKAGRKLDQQTVIDHCRLFLAHYKCPRRVTFTILPKISTGKIQKSLLVKIFGN